MSFSCEAFDMFGGRLPFVGRIFWKILPVVAVLVVLGFWVSLKLFDDYNEVTNADKVGSTISAILLSYLLHLWMLPAEELGGGGGTSEDPHPDQAARPDTEES